MRKLRFYKKLQFTYSRAAGVGRAFSLAELVISIGILILMMALAGQVFTITVRSTGQATALTETTQQLRALEDTLREDLRNVQAGQSLILIQGNPVNAYWTQAQKDADALVDGNPETGYPHLSDPERERVDATGSPVLDAKKETVLLERPRADILMLFTSSKGTSYTRPGVTGGLQQVVYGHAELGEYELNANAAPGSDQYKFKPDLSANPDRSMFPLVNTNGVLYPADPTTSANVAALPASQWHLSRRSVLLLPTRTPSSGLLTWGAIKAVAGLGRNEFVEGAEDVVEDFRFDDIVLRSSPLVSQGPWFPPSVFGDTLKIQLSEWHKPFARSRIDPAPPPTYAGRLGAYFVPNCASFKVEWALDPKCLFVAGRLDGTSEVFWFDAGNTGDAGVASKGPDPLQALQTRIDALGKNADDASNRLRRSLESLLCDQTQHADGSRYSLADRFRGVTCTGNKYDANLAWAQLAPDGRRPNLEIFTATRPAISECDVSRKGCRINSDCPSGEYCEVKEPAPDDIWPGTLRITVDIFDRERRLDRPIRHVMVIPVGR